jgi:hypothetical protein
MRTLAHTIVQRHPPQGIDNSAKLRGHVGPILAKPVDVLPEIPRDALVEKPPRDPMVS